MDRMPTRGSYADPHQYWIATAEWYRQALAAAESKLDAATYDVEYLKNDNRRFSEALSSETTARIAAESKLDGLQLQLDSWREAYRKLTAGDHAEVRLDTDGAIDEVVGSGVFHMEQMDTNCWFFDLAGCRFNINGKKVTLTPIEVDTWAEEQKRVAVAK